MARLLSPDALAAWLDRALPGLEARALSPARVSDPSDGRLAHLDGLNLSRAWMLFAIAAALEADDPRRRVCVALAETHERAGIAAIGGRPYEGTHWLGTFAAYLLTHPARPGTR